MHGIVRLALQNEPESLARSLSRNTLAHNNSAFDSLAAVELLIQANEHEA